MLSSGWTLLFALATSARAQFPPEPEGVKSLPSKFHSGIKISYKEPGICETTPGVKSYAGYVHLPPNALDEAHEGQDYPINTFFWFFESRKDPRNAPLAIWLNGGPGGSSLLGALSENGPCFIGNDSNSTYLNPWSWNNEVNLLFIDQPNQVGYSYDTPTNVTVTIARESEFDSEEPNVRPTDFSDGVPAQNLTFLVGTAGSQNFSHTANSTDHAAVALWHFAQTWFEEFPHYKPERERISLFTESYGGHYGPAFVSHFMKQNELIANGTISGPGVHYLHIDTLGIINGCIDAEDGNMAYATFANNNTYGVKVFTEPEYHRAMYELTRPDGGIDQLHECQRLQKKLDPNNYGDVERVNAACVLALSSISNVTTAVFMKDRRHGWYDVTHPFEDPFPSAYHLAFLNQHWVQKALGVPVNHTLASGAVATAFDASADQTRGDLLEDIAYVLDHGVRVAMIYGDRDYACNWVGGERSSLRVPWSGQHDFSRAGYAPLAVSHLRSAGLTRQFGNLSFTRVYQAGHMVPSYQPDAAYAIFMRAIAGRDIATGVLDLDALAASGRQYSSRGPRDTWWMPSELLPVPPHECYVLNPDRCSEEEWRWIRDGTAVVRDWVVVGRKGDGAGSLVPGAAADVDQMPLQAGW